MQPTPVPLYEIDPREVERVAIFGFLLVLLVVLALSILQKRRK